MCGRMTSTTPVEQIAKALDVDELTVGAENFVGSYNVAPTQEILVVTARNDHRKLQMMRWGLVPFFAKDFSSSALMINARAEGLSRKPAYRRPFEKRRCLIHFDGFYEWQRLDEKSKQPWHLYPKCEQKLAFAGLWDVWHDPQLPADSEPLLSCTVITTAANAEINEVHDRMPLILTEDAWDGWLDVEGTTVDHAQAQLKTPKLGLLQKHTVGKDVNSVCQDGEHLIEPVHVEPALRLL